MQFRFARELVEHGGGFRVAGMLPAQGLSLPLVRFVSHGLGYGVRPTDMTLRRRPEA